LNPPAEPSSLGLAEFFSDDYTYALLLKANTAAVTITAENTTRKRAFTEMWACPRRLEPKIQKFLLCSP